MHQVFMTKNKTKSPGPDLMKIFWCKFTLRQNSSPLTGKEMIHYQSSNLRQKFQDPIL